MTKQEEEKFAFELGYKIGYDEAIKNKNAKIDDMFDALKNNSIDNSLTIKYVDLFILSWRKEINNEKNL